MKALVKAKREPGLWMEDVPKPSVGPNDVLVKVQKTGICGTDVHIYNWDEWSQRTIKTPMHIGHEFMGVVAELGSEVTGLKVGDRVSGEGHITCGTCRNCRAGKRHLCRNTIGLGVNRPGCFAEYVALPAFNVFPVPASVPDEIAAFFDPLGNAVHTALSFDLVGEDVLITGAGPIGVMAAAVCRHAGARHVVLTDVNDFRLDLGRKLGATRTVNVTKEDLGPVMKELGMIEGFDVALEMSGNAAAFHQLLKAMNHGGRVALLGIPPGELAIDWGQVIFKGLLLKGIYGREMFETWYKMSSMLQSGLDVSAAVTHRFPADRFAEAFEVMRTGQSGKVVLDWAA
jgi:threonine 3-dehydrogenase